MNNKILFLLWTGIIVLIGGALGYGYADKLKNRETVAEAERTLEATKQKPLSEFALNDDDHVLGNLEKAKVVVVEYSDTECPWCKSFHQKYKENIVSAYPEEVALVYRHFPLAIYPRSKKEAEALECAAEQGGNELFWAYLDELFRVTPSSNNLDPAELPRIADRLELDQTSFVACLDDGRFAAKVADQRLGGAQLGVYQTPSVIVWDKATGETKLISGANSRFEEVRALVEYYLSENP